MHILHIIITEHKSEYTKLLSQTRTHPDPPVFPTRRSSDLTAGTINEKDQATLLGADWETTLQAKTPVKAVTDGKSTRLNLSTDNNAEETNNLTKDSTDAVTAVKQR